MTPSDRDPAADLAASGGSQPPTPTDDQVPAAAPVDPTPGAAAEPAPSRWLASSEGLVPAVPPAEPQWAPAAATQPAGAAGAPVYDPAAYAPAAGAASRGTWSAPTVA